MLKSGKRWNILQVTESIVEQYNDSSTYYVKFDEDTIINTLTYRHVFRATNTGFTDKTLNGYVREDTTVGLYFRNLKGEESLLYKYNLHLGDSVIIQNIPWLNSIRYLVTGIDSILIDSQYKKRYIMSEKYYEYWPETWVEGVGSSIGILGCGVHSVGGWTNLLCSYENDKLIYKNPYFQNCYYYFHSPRVELHSVRDSESGINVRSGALLNEVFIESQVDNYIRIFNCYGMFLEAVHVLANQEYRLNVSKYPKGIYIISPSTNLSSAKKFSRF
jgi:hypothetical protein